jgi:UDP-N-acetylglucosamine/UDP-N-acetylgalactosamine diphosphorylase
MELESILEQHGQTHLLRFWDELSSNERQSLEEQIASVDFTEIERLLASNESAASNVETPSQRALRAQPPREMVRLPVTDSDQQQLAEAVTQGNELLAAGKVGCILVAGGQGTRLGFDKPKGMFQLGPVSNAPMFEMLAHQLLARSRRAGIAIPYYVMTSDATHEETVAFFKEQHFFGLAADDVRFFRQGNMPAVDAETGKLLLASKGQLACSPDGHGGMLAGLKNAGLIDDMSQRGIELLYYHQVDNPTAIVCDPAFLGLHVSTGSEMSTKVVAKRSAEERMGVVVDVDEVTQIIEYSDLPDEVAQRLDANGNLDISAGNMAIHLFDREFLERLSAGDLALPFHIAHKTVEHIDEKGHAVQPAEPNAYKFEKFIFDAMPRAKRALVMEVDRAREFNPVKNAEGDDSPATSRAALMALHRGWVEAAGVVVANDVPVEIDPLFALDATEVKQKVTPGTKISEPTCYVEVT